MTLRFSVLLLVAAGAASADQVVLKGGGTLSGVLVQQTPEAVTIEVALGRVTLPASRVERIIAGDSALGEYRSRALGLQEGDTFGWLSLGLWARDHGLHAQAREAFQRVLARDPGNAVAHEAMGNVRLGERWVSPEESYRAQGLVYYEGQWMTREDRDFVSREREASARVEAADRARVEAEARAREAEARAEEAAAQARQAAEYDSSGFPYDWVWWGGGCCIGDVRPSHGRHGGRHGPSTGPPPNPGPRPQAPPPRAPTPPKQASTSSRGKR
jgi:tetratricopeptide (TPR) repeat protein